MESAEPPTQIPVEYPGSRSLNCHYIFFLSDDELSEASQETTDPSGTQEQTCKDSRLQSESQFTKSTKDKPAEILKPEESAAHGKEYQEKAEGKRETAE